MPCKFLAALSDAIERHDLAKLQSELQTKVKQIVDHYVYRTPPDDDSVQASIERTTTITIVEGHPVVLVGCTIHHLSWDRPAPHGNRRRTVAPSTWTYGLLLELERALQGAGYHTSRHLMGWGETVGIYASRPGEMPNDLA